MKKRTVAILLAIVLVFGAAVGGTLAWLMSKPDAVVNTFTSGDVEITLTETFNADKDATAGNDSWENQMVPGNTYLKDPKVTVTGNTNVDCYVFVKFEESAKASTYLTYTFVSDGWTKFSEETDTTTGAKTTVWYREVAKNATVKEWYLLAGNQTYANGCITVNANTVTKQTMEEAAAQTLTFTAYAVQKDNLKVADAWDLVD